MADRGKQFQLFDPGPRRPAKDSLLPEQEIALGGRLTVRAPGKALPGILEKGAIMNQHDTGTSAGAYEPNLRSAWEANADFERPPIYGYMDNPGHDDYDTNQYGPNKFRLKRELRDRSRVALGDSLESDAYPVPLADAESGRADIPFGHTDYTGYVEAQITPRAGERGVPLSDVSALEMGEWRNKLRWDDTPTAHSDLADPNSVRRTVGKQFQDRGVNVTHHYERPVYQPPLPYSDPELHDQGFLSPKVDFETGNQIRERPKMDEWGRGLSVPENYYRQKYVVNQRDLDR